MHSDCADCGEPGINCTACHCCEDCCGCIDEDLFDADELGLDPETDIPERE